VITTLGFIQFNNTEKKSFGVGFTLKTISQDNYKDKPIVTL